MIAALLLALGGALAEATELDVFFNASPSTALTDCELPDVTESAVMAGGLKVSLNPLVLSEDHWVLTNRFQFHTLAADGDILGALLGGPARSLHGLFWQPGTKVRFAQRWSLVAFVRGGLYGDLVKGVGARHFRTRGASWAQFTFKAPWTVGFGAAYAATPRGALVFPLIRARYGGDRLKVAISLPQFAEIRAPLMNALLQVGVALKLSSESYSVRGAQVEDVVVTYRLAALRPFLETRGGRFRLRANAGWAFWRKYALTDGAPSAGGASDPGWVFGFSAGYAPKYAP